MRRIEIRTVFLRAKWACSPEMRRDDLSGRHHSRKEPSVVFLPMSRIGARAIQLPRGLSRAAASMPDEHCYGPIATKRRRPPAAIYRTAGFPYNCLQYPIIRPEYLGAPHWFRVNIKMREFRRETPGHISTNRFRSHQAPSMSEIRLFKDRSPIPTLREYQPSYTTPDV